MRRPGRILLLICAALLLLLVLGRVVVQVYTEALWFSSVGYSSVYWTRLGSYLGVRATAGVLAAALVFLNLWIVFRRLGPVQLRRQYGNIEIAEQVPRGSVLAGIIAVSFLGGWWLSGLKFDAADALSVLAWLRHAKWGVLDPLFGRDLSFYVLSLPVYFRIVDFLLLSTIWSMVLVLLGSVLAGTIRWRDGRLEVGEDARLHFIVLASALVLLLGVRYWIGRYGLVLEGTGIGGGLGYTDVEARLPAQRILAILAILSAVGLLYGAWRRSWVPPVIAVGALAGAALLLGQLYPAIVQRFQVEPNQLSRESRFIGWNLEFTRMAYGLDRLERRSMEYRSGGPPSWEEVAPALAQLPLWDPEPLRVTFNQVEAIFGYYGFPDVDYDRYPTPDGLRGVGISVREFDLSGLPEEARTWQTVHLNPKYIRGAGVVAAPTAESGAGGEPVRWLRNLDPVVREPAAPTALDLVQPGVYFGEAMGVEGRGQDYVILIPGRDSTVAGEPGRDYPDGIRLGSFSRLLAFAWRFRDKNMLFSGELTEESRLVFRRALHRRIREVAPFAVWDRDPYPVVANGRIHWIIDGYTASSSFPLSRPISIPDVGTLRYLRNSLKATVDALTGEMAIYAVDDEDPLLETYRRIFPGLVRPLGEMPANLQAHLRYPLLYFRAQAEILREYHLTRPDAFYAGQDFWQLAQEFSEEGPRPYRPIHALMPMPGGDGVEFLLTMPFIARERQNMTALLVARSDPPNYGQLILLQLPRDQQIPGPSQVAALMEQDPAISPQLSLWRQAGSDVDLGRLRVVPLASSFLYVQPIFLSARESSIPELARVVVSDGSTVSMAPTLAQAVAGLRAPRAESPTEHRGTPIETGSPPGTHAWPRQALELLDDAEARLRSGDWAGFGERWRALRIMLEALRDHQP